MVGSAIHRLLKQRGEDELIYRSRQELDLTKQNQVESFFEQLEVDQVYLAAAKVGGIFANQNQPAEFIYDNLQIQNNVIHAAFQSGVKKLLFLGSSCIYPKHGQQPLKESELLNGKLEPTNEPYALAKISGMKLCESYNRQYGESHGVDYRCVMPTNLYGPGDNYDLEDSHVLPALIRKIHEAKVSGAKTVKVWGTGSPKREFLHADDLARACVHVMELDASTFKKVTEPQTSHLNVGSGKELSVRELAELISRLLGFQGKLEFDDQKPDGTPQKLLDSSLIHQLGWMPEIPLEKGILMAYEDFKTYIPIK